MIILESFNQFSNFTLEGLTRKNLLALQSDHQSPMMAGTQTSAQAASLDTTKLLPRPTQAQLAINSRSCVVSTTKLSPTMFTIDYCVDFYIRCPRGNNNGHFGRQNCSPANVACVRLPLKSQNLHFFCIWRQDMKFVGEISVMGCYGVIGICEPDF